MQLSRSSSRKLAVALTCMLAACALAIIAGYAILTSQAGTVGFPTLHAAVWRQDVPQVRLLLTRDPASVNTPLRTTWGNSLDGATPLMLAAARGDEPLVELLLAHGADPLQRDPHGRTTAEYAEMYGNAIALLDREP